MALSIMIVDDSQSSLTVMKLLLNKAGINDVTVHSSPKEALDSIQKGTIPSLVITDFKMPEMNGLQLLEAVSALYPEIPAFIISGDSDSVRSQSRSYPVLEKGGPDFFDQIIQQIKIYTGEVRETAPENSNRKTLSKKTS